MSVSSWEIFADMGIAGLLLLTGQLLRSRLGVLQRMFLPASVIGGFLGLGLGPNGAKVLTLSEAFSVYPSILIALIFAALPFASERVDLKGASRQLTDMWSFSAVATLLQWGLGVLFTIVLLRQLWPDLNPGFGAVLASGFVGGHGTAAAVGETFLGLGWNEATSLFTWGWITGVTALGITLLRIVDSENGSRALNDFALAYLFVVPLEIALVAFGPQVIMTGNSRALAGITIGAAVLISVLVRRVNRN